MLDNSQQISDNVINDDYAAIAGIDANTQIVKMDEMTPINDTGCKHETLIADPLDTIEDAVFHGCANTQCGVGFYIQPTIK